MRRFVRTPALAGALVIAAVSHASAVQHCYCVVSNSMSGGAPPVAYQFRACFRDGTCEQWQSRTFETRSAFGIKTHCHGGQSFARFQLRFDAGTPRIVDLPRTQTFDIPPDSLPSCACVTKAQYHFLRQGGNVSLNQGLPAVVGMQPCRVVKTN